MIYGLFRPEAVPQPLGGGQVMRPTLETVARAASRNAALTFGIMGGVLGLALGLTGGLIRRSIGSAAEGGLVGLFLGAILGASLPLVLIEPYRKMQVWRNSDDLLVPMCLHATLWGPLGAVGGLAFGIGCGRPRQALRWMVGGLAGAVIGTIAYGIIGTAVDPMSGTSDAISGTTAARLLAHLFVPVGTVVAILFSDHDPEPQAASPDSSRADASPDGGR